MRVLKLTIKSAIDGALLGTARWTSEAPSHLELVDMDPDLEATFRRWERSGLREWVPDESGLLQRVTAVTSRLFLPRVADDLRGQFGLRIEFDEVPIFELRGFAPSSSTSTIWRDGDAVFEHAGAMGGEIWAA